MTVQPGSAFLSLVEVMDRLRSPGGCPWDARQTHESLVEYLVEETYETVEAIETGDRAGLREELGDLLLQVVFHARIAEEDPESAWGIDDVVEGIIAKLVGRHPHVFGDEVAGTADEVEANWHARKAIEKGRTSVTDGIPMQLPALVLAAKVLARSVAFTDDLGESSRHEAALAAVDDVFSEEAFGDLLLGLVTIGRDEGWDAEAALRGATRRRIDAIRAIEANDG
ncbi:MAG: MazG family protein [Actinobacteria bacterium]|nr:MazG family protein [Actinomycetota bacterium]